MSICISWKRHHWIFVCSIYNIDINSVQVHWVCCIQSIHWGPAYWWIYPPEIMASGPVVALFGTGAHEIAILMGNNLKQTIKLDLGFPLESINILWWSYECLSLFIPLLSLFDYIWLWWFDSPIIIPIDEYMIMVIPCLYLFHHTWQLCSHYYPYWTMYVCLWLFDHYSCETI